MSADERLVRPPSAATAALIVKWTLRSAVAKPLGAISPLVTTDKSYRAWLELRKTF
jgi:hypothetical protein